LGIWIPPKPKVSVYIISDGAPFFKGAAAFDTFVRNVAMIGAVYGGRGGAFRHLRVKILKKHLTSARDSARLQLVRTY
jgi:hypothetical protein